MVQIRIQADGRSPAEIAEYLEKAVGAVGISQDTDFRDPEMQRMYADELALFTQIMDAMTQDIEALD